MELDEAVMVEVKEILRETEKAWQIRTSTEILWIPKSQGRILNNYLYISKWLADNKGIDYDRNTLIAY